MYLWKLETDWGVIKLLPLRQGLKMRYSSIDIKHEREAHETLHEKEINRLLKIG